MIIKYKGYGVYRFLDDYKNTIYIGMTDNIYRRLFEQHFTKNGHLAKRGKDYNKVAKVEYIKLNDPADTSGFEMYLIDKYKPIWNSSGKRKSINMLDYKQKDYYESIEKWETARVFREFDEDKVKLNRNQVRLAIVATYAMFIAIIIYMIL